MIAAAQRLFDAMAASDSTALRALLHPEAKLLAILPGGQVRIQEDVAEAWVRDVARSEETLRERMWDPRVEVQGDIAMLWAPYDFHLGDAFSHCGIDAFQFVRDGTDWRLLVVSFTVQREGCATAPSENQ